MSALTISVLEIGFVIAMLAMAVMDVAWRRLPNWLNIVIALGFLPYAWALGMNWTQIGLAFGVGAVVLAVGIGLFSFGLIGGGDVKLVAAISIWIGPSLELMRFFLGMTLLGGVLAVIALVWQASTGKAITRALPYGVAIAIAGLDHWLRHNHLFGSGLVG